MSKLQYFYRCPQKSKLRTIVHSSSPNIDRFSFLSPAILRKNYSKVVTKYIIPPHLICVATLPFEKNFQKSLQSVTINTSIYDTLPVSVDIKRRYCHTGWSKIKLQALVHIFINGFYIFIFHKVV